MTARTFPRAAAIDCDLAVLVAQLEVERRLARRDEPVARRRRRRLDGGREQPAEAARARGRTRPRAERAASALEPQHFVGTGRGDPHVLGVDGERGGVGADAHGASGPGRRGPAPARSRGQHVDVLARGGERDRTAADGDRVASTAPRPRSTAHDPPAGGVGDPGRVARERDVDRRAADPHRRAGRTRACARRTIVSVPPRSSTATTRRASAASATGLYRPAAAARRRAAGLDHVDAAVGRARDPDRAARERDVAGVGARLERRERARRRAAASGSTAPAAASATQTPDAPSASRAGAPPGRSASPIGVAFSASSTVTAPERDAATQTRPSATTMPVGPPATRRRPAGAAHRRRTRGRRAPTATAASSAAPAASARRGRAAGTSGAVASAAMGNAIRAAATFSSAALSVCVGSRREAVWRSRFGPRDGLDRDARPCRSGGRARAGAAGRSREPRRRRDRGEGRRRPGARVRHRDRRRARPAGDVGAGRLGRDVAEARHRARRPLRADRGPRAVRRTRAGADAAARARARLADRQARSRAGAGNARHRLRPPPRAARRRPADAARARSTAPLQLDAPLVPEAAGGPVLDAEGRLVGIGAAEGGDDRLGRGQASASTSCSPGSRRVFAGWQGQYDCVPRLHRLTREAHPGLPRSRTRG